MKKFMIALSLPLAFAMGCGGSESDDPADNNTPDNGVGGGSNNGPGPNDTGTVKSGLVVAKAPAGLSGDFFFGDDLLCGGASSCEANVEGAITIKFVCPKHLFVPKTASGNPDADVQVTWDNPGDWGLAPSGTYYDEQSQYEAPVKTWVQDDQILLDHDGTVIGAVEGNTFAWTSEAGSKYTGIISDDLTSISYHTVKANGKEFDNVLTLVE